MGRIARLPRYCRQQLCIVQYKPSPHVKFLKVCTKDKKNLQKINRAPDSQRNCRDKSHAAAAPTKDLASTKASKAVLTACIIDVTH